MSRAEKAQANYLRHERRMQIAWYIILIIGGLVIGVLITEVVRAAAGMSLFWHYWRLLA